MRLEASHIIHLGCVRVSVLAVWSWIQELTFWAHENVFRLDFQGELMLDEVLMKYGFVDMFQMAMVSYWQRFEAVRMPELGFCIF